MTNRARMGCLPVSTKPVVTYSTLPDLLLSQPPVRSSPLSLGCQNCTMSKAFFSAFNKILTNTTSSAIGTGVVLGVHWMMSLDEPDRIVDSILINSSSGPILWYFRIER